MDALITRHQLQWIMIMWCIEGIIIWLVKWFVVNWLRLGTCVAPCPSNVCWKGSLHSHNKVKWLIHYSFVYLINNRIWTFISVDEIICKLEWPWSRASWDLNFYLSDLNSMCRWYLVAFLNETPRWLVIGVWCLVWWGSKNNHHKHICFKMIGLHLQKI